MEEQRDRRTITEGALKFIQHAMRTLGGGFWKSALSGAKIMAPLMAVILAGAGTSWGAQTVNAPLYVTAPLASSAQLTLSPTVINFPDADPDVVPDIPANENPVQVTVSTQTGTNKTVTLRVQAQGDLVSGSNIIEINNINWKATGDGFLPGTMSTSASMLAGQWRGPGIRTGTFSFFLKNSWSYATGNYTQRVTFTLTAP